MESNEYVEDELEEEIEKGEEKKGGYNLEPLTPEEIAEIKAEVAAEHAMESKNNKVQNEEECEECDDKSTEDSEIEEEENLSESINKLIAEAKKRKVSETNDLNFLKFLNKSQVDSFYSLSDGDQELVKLHINESDYFSSRDVLKLISEALSQKSETVEQRVLRLMPSNINKLWEQLNESSKKSILSQARLYPEELLMNESQIDNFWNTRKFKTEQTTKKLISHQDIIQEDVLSDNEMKSIMEKFKNL